MLSIAAPFGGSYWYALTLLSPLAGGYYWQRGSRVEEVAVRHQFLSFDMVTVLLLFTISILLAICKSIGPICANKLIAECRCVPADVYYKNMHAFAACKPQHCCKAAAGTDRCYALQVKMVTADDDSTTDIVVEGDQEEVTRMSKELQLVEKGKVYVKGLLE